MSWFRITDVTEASDFQLHTIAKQVCEALMKHYPGHLWETGWGGGSLYVRNPAISMEYGFRIHPDLSATSSEFEEKAVRYGGELLERAHMKRGRWNGQEAETLDGADPLRFQLERLRG